MLHEVIEGLAELGVGGATVVESRGMGNIISQDIPIFAGFRHLLGGSRPFNYTIFSVVPDAELAREAGDGETELGALANLAVVSFESGRAAEAAERNAHAIEAARARHDPRVEAGALSFRLHLDLAAGDYAGAMRSGEACVEFERKAGLRGYEAVTHSNLAIVCYQLGRLEAARDRAPRRAACARV